MNRRTKWYSIVFAAAVMVLTVSGIDTNSVEELQALLDRFGQMYSLQNVDVREDGRVSAVYSVRHRTASEIIAACAGDSAASMSLSRKVVADDNVNRIFLTDEPKAFVETVRAWYAADRPPPAVRITCDVLKVNLGRDERIAAASEAWQAIAAEKNRQEKGSASMHLQGFTSQAFVQHVAYLVTTGLAEVVTRQVVSVQDRQTMQIAAVNRVGLRSGGTGEVLKGIYLDITPSISDTTLVLDVQAMVHADIAGTGWGRERTMVSTNSVRIALADNELCSLIGLREAQRETICRKTRLSGIPLIGSWFDADEIRTNLYEYIIMIRPVME